MESVTKTGNFNIFLENKEIQCFSFREIKAVLPLYFRDILLTILSVAINCLMGYWDTKEPENSGSQSMVFPRIFVFTPLGTLLSFQQLLWQSVHDSFLWRWNQIHAFLPSCNSVQTDLPHLQQRAADQLQFESW